MPTKIVPLSKKEKQKYKLEKQALVLRREAAKVIKIEKKNKKELPEQAVKKSKSMFARKRQLIHNKVDAGDIDQAITLIQKQMLKMLVDVMPIAERGYRKYGNERAAYALNAMVSGAREVISDIQATKDQMQLIDKIVVGVLQPAFTSIAQQVVASTQHSYKELEDYIDLRKKDLVKSVLSSSAKELGRYLNDQLNFVRTRLEKEIG
jgi:hypothetical protein